MMIIDTFVTVDEAEICEKEGCMRHVDKYCTNCMKFLCYR